MLSSTLTLDDASGDDIAYVQVPFQGLGARRIVRNRPVSTPKELLIQHTEATRTANARRLISFRQTELDSKGVAQTGVLNLTYSAPLSEAISTQMVKDMIAELVSFLTDKQITSVTAMTNVEAFLGGEA